MSDYASLLGVPKRFTDPDTGKVYSIGHITQSVKGEFENWLKGRARAELLAMKPHLSADEWREEWRNYQDGVTTGEYAFYSELGQAALSSPGGVLFLASRLFVCDTDEMESLMLRHGDAVQALMDEIAAESAPRPKRKPEGNAPAPVV